MAFAIGCAMVSGMEIQGPVTVEELQEANTLFVPRLLRGSVRARLRQTLHPSKGRLAIQAVSAAIVLSAIAVDPRLQGHAQWLLFAALAAVFGYRIFFAARAAQAGYEKKIESSARVLSVDSDGVRFENREKRMDFRPWSGYKKWREGDLVFVLKGPQRTMHVIPKRGLTQDQKEELRRLLEQRCNAGAELALSRETPL